MKRTALLLLLIGLFATPALAQGRGKRNGHQQGIPPGHVPPAGMCRVWYEGVPPGQQPRPTSCANAERLAAGDRGARVIYGDTTRQNAPVYGPYPDDRRETGSYPGDIWRDRDGRVPDDDRRYPDTDGRRPNRDASGRTSTGRAIPRGEQYPNSYPYPDARYPQGRSDSQYGYASEAYRRGYDDGVTKGREDTRDGDSFDPARHGWYRDGDRGYNSRYGSRDEYRSEYRRGFLAGYEANHDGRRSSSRPSWWPF